MHLARRVKFGLSRSLSRDRDSNGPTEKPLYSITGGHPVVLIGSPYTGTIKSWRTGFLGLGALRSCFLLEAPRSGDEIRQ